MDSLGAKSSARISDSRGGDSHTKGKLKGVAMSAKENPTYYRLELDDCSAAAFTSFGKHYYGTMEDLRCFFRELTIDVNLKKQFRDLISAFQSFEEGRQNINHYIAYRKVPFLVPAHLLHKKTVILENYEWEHTNTWGLPYYMRCDKVESEHLWFACDGEYCRTVKAVFSKLQYAGDVGRWKHVGTMLWGFPCILAGNQFGFRNRLAESEKQFKTMEEVQQDWEVFLKSPDPDYSEFCNDIFGDG